MNITKEVKKYERIVEDLRKKLTENEVVLNYLKTKQGGRGLSGRPRGHRRRSEDSLSSKIESLLKETGRAMKVSEIASELELRGATTNSKHGLGPMVASALKKGEKIFERVSYGTYVIKGQTGQTNKVQEISIGE